MKAYDTGSIRNVAVVGHSGAGKTQLVAALLFAAGATPRLGRVDDGTTITDYDDEEIARKHTLAASLAWAEWNKSKINFIDTPGMGNFLSDARAGLRVADAALLVVDAVAGVEVQTEKVWAEAASLELPRLVIVNRLDRERASLERTLGSIREFCSRAVVPIQLPLGEERQFAGVVDLVSMRAWRTGADGKSTDGPVPPEMYEAAKAGRDALIETVAEADDALMERFFESGTLSQEELVAGLRAGTLAGRIFPLVCASGLTGVGVTVVARRNRRIRAIAARASGHCAARQRRRAGLGGPGRRGALRRVCLEDDCRSLRRPDHAVPRIDGHAQVRHDDSQPHAGYERASRSSHRDSGQDHLPA